jgi:TonB family protein
VGTAIRRPPSKNRREYAMLILARRPPAALAAVILLAVCGLPLLAQGIYKIDSFPKRILKVEPEYTDRARAAKLEGVVVLNVVIDEEGIPRDPLVVRWLGMGLDGKALEAVRQWRFRPAMEDGEPVRLAVVVEVTFRLPKEPKESGDEK